MPDAVIFVGIQGAGKSAFYRQHFFDTHVRINLDMLHTRRREKILFAACLEAGQSFVVDNTNPLPRDRARYIEPSRKAGFAVLAYYFQVSLQDALARNARRHAKQKIPVAAVVGAFKKLREPAPEEGFDRIYLVEVGANYQFAVTQSATKT